tara:strand:- start:556 stop:3930 length:3375 start_codon:yes stop_codon:yes gene_type:complete
MYGTQVNRLGKREKNAKIKEASCIFPFKYKWKTHNECFPTEKGPICATSVTPRQTLKTYGYCTDKAPSKPQKLTLRKKKNPKSRTQKKAPNSIPKQIKRNIDLDLTQKVKVLKTVKPTMEKSPKQPEKRYNEEFIKILKEFDHYLSLRGEVFRARAYKKAMETIMTIPEDVTSVEQLKGQKGVGKTILEKFEEYVKTGKIAALEKEKTNPTVVFANIYGVGPKKAKELVEKHKVKTIEELREKQADLLNDKQKLGLKYYEDILKRIPRSEIDEYQNVLTKEFEHVVKENEIKGTSKFEIVGSYRRGVADSGDIDLIITNDKDNADIFIKFVDRLIEKKIVVDVLSRGKVKSLAVSQIPGKSPRRIDFLYTSPQEYAFALVYFTGSMAFNTAMRQRALTLGYTLNEHSFHKMEKGRKGQKLLKKFETEQDIFDFLNMEFKEPHERVGIQSMVLKMPDKEVKKSKKTTLKVKRFRLKDDKALLEQFSKQGINIIADLTEKRLNSMLLLANDMYYNETSILSDSLYDILKEHIERKFPKNKVIEDIGAPVEKNKVTLPYFMASMDKIKPDTKELGKWKSTYKGPYVMSAKLDGISGMYSSEGDTPKLYTRGNGSVGQDVSYLIPYLELPPLTQKGVVIRGEFIIKKSVFKAKYAADFANSRNFVGGVINAKKSGKTKYQDIDFVGYEVIKPSLKPSEQMKFMEENNVIPVRNSTKKDITNQELSELLVAWRNAESDKKSPIAKEDKYEYEIDGIIVANDEIYERTKKNPKHAFAFKMVLSDQVAEAKVLDVIWTPSKDGYLKPRIRIEPIFIGGAEIRYATAFNGAFVRDNKIGIGAVIQLVRSGDVIPHIMGVLTPADEAKMPPIDSYKWNATNVDIMLIDAQDNEIVKEKNIIGFFTGMDVVGLGPGNVHRLMKGGFDSVPKILKMSESDFLKVEGFKKKMSAKIYEGIREKLESVKLSKLMANTNVFGRGMGQRRIDAILKEHPDILLSKEEPAAKIEKVLLLKGFAKKTAQDFVNYIPQFMEFMKEADLMYKITNKQKEKDEKPIDKSNPLFEKKFYMTGTRDKDLIKKIEDMGGIFGSSVSKKTFALIYADKELATSDKVEKAKKMGVPTYTKDEFVAKYFT